MRWPRGKYNGRRIEGFKVHFTLHLFYWQFRPLLHWNHGEPRFSWLCFTWMAAPAYVFWDFDSPPRTT